MPSPSPYTSGRAMKQSCIALNLSTQLQIFPFGSSSLNTKHESASWFSSPQGPCAIPPRHGQSQLISPVTGLKAPALDSSSPSDAGRVLTSLCLTTTSGLRVLCFQWVRVAMERPKLMPRLRLTVCVYYLTKALIPIHVYGFSSISWLKTFANSVPDHHCFDSYALSLLSASKRSLLGPTA